MGDRGDELALHLLILADLQGHIVDGVGELADLVVIPLLELDTVAAGGNALGRLGNARHGVYDGLDEVDAGSIHEQHQQKAPQHDQQDHLNNLPIHHRQRSHQAHDRLHLAPIDNGAGHRHDPLPRIGVPAHPVVGIHALNG